MGELLSVRYTEIHKDMFRGINAKVRSNINIHG
jgi:hypothetical protein